MAEPAPSRPRPPDGLVVVDKPAGCTSHDVVAQVRRLAGTRRVGHAGTLDPMATGVLVLGLGRGTRLLGHLTLADKTYMATVRLGRATSTDDATGEVVAETSAGRLPDAALAAGLARLRGTIQQVPSAVSAVKVGGRRAYARVRAGEAVELAARTVTVTELTLLDVRREDALVDLDLRVTCSTGTYVRALARDLGRDLGVGGHLTRLRRTRVGPYEVGAARTLEQLAEDLAVLPLDAAVAAAFPRHDIDAAAAARVRHGVPLPAGGAPAGPMGVFGPDGALLALAEQRDGALRYLAVLAD